LPSTRPIVTERQLRNLRFRPIRPDDWRRLRRFHLRLTSSTVELRFHGAKRELSVPLALRLTNLDGRDNVGIVATTGTRGRIVAVGRYSRLSSTTAEVAFVVEDAYQHHGLGRRLMQRLKRIALQNGITTFVAEVLPGNLPMIKLLDETGPTHTRFLAGVCEVRLDLRTSGSECRVNPAAVDS
jgi:GNAT superfamily N-acetyltransferase